MTARRKALRLRERLRPWLRRSGFALLVAVALIGLAATREGLDAELSVVRVTGELTAAERDRAVELVSAYLPAGILDFDAAGLARRLGRNPGSTLPACGGAGRTRSRSASCPRWPSPRWQDDALLSSRGRVIEPLELVGVDALPRLHGPDGSAGTIMERFIQASGMLSPLGMAVTELRADAAGNIRIGTDKGIRIFLGSDALAARMRRVARVIEQELHGRLADVERIDARYDNGIAVAWRTPDIGTGSELVSQATEGSRDPWPIPNHR
ncbi:MAG: cell division protein FtsQ/DivIB [Gammaproteobacteria bacterium]|nr:cell division protein FtsQ/DivIB [Gammaproteobacteria bacterium]